MTGATPANHHPDTPGQPGRLQVRQATGGAGRHTATTPTAPAQPPTTPRDDCVFCAIAAGRAPATVAHTWADTLAIHPRNPVAPGHLLVIPREHVTDIGTDPAVSARTMAAAAELAADLPAANIITSKGIPATQNQFHLHLHVVPRTAGDGLPLPWTPRHTADHGKDTDPR